MVLEYLPNPDRTLNLAARTVRQRTLPQIGESGQRLLTAATIAVVGAGGLGSPVIQYLAAAGIGTIHVIDDDHVELSNLNRQTLHGVDTLGQLKTAGAVTAAQRLSPETTVISRTVRLTDDNAQDILRDAEVIIDGSDSFTTRFIIHRAAVALSRPVVYGALMQWNAQVTVFWSSPPYESGLQPTVLTDVFPDTAATHASPGCAEAGVLGAVVGITGSFMALEALKLVLATGEPLLGRILLIDGLAGTTSQIRVSGSASVCSKNPTTMPAHHQSLLAVGDEPDSVLIPSPVPLSMVDPGSVWIDVRRPEESDENPGPPGTITLPLDQVLRLDTGPETPLRDDHAFAALSPGQPLMPFCASGPRSVSAARHLSALGWPVIGYLDGGLPQRASTEPPTESARPAPAMTSHRDTTGEIT